ASFVLASLGSSTGTRPPHHSAARTDLVLLIRRTVRPRGYASDPRSLRPRLGQGASWRARVGRVRRQVVLSILPTLFLLALSLPPPVKLDNCSSSGIRQRGRSHHPSIHPRRHRSPRQGTRSLRVL